MCLGGGPDYQYQEPVKYNPPPGPPSPDDMVNNITVANANLRSEQQTKRNANRGSLTTPQTSKY